MMTEKEQIAAFAADVTAVVNRYRSEFQITIASAIGVLHVVAWEILTEEQDDTND